MRIINVKQDAKAIRNKNLGSECIGQRPMEESWSWPGPTLGCSAVDDNDEKAVF